MSASVDEFRSRARPQTTAQDRIVDLKGLAQEVPRMAALTGSADWDMYLRYVEANIKATERMIEDKRNQAASLVLIDEAKARVAAMQAVTLQSRRDTLLELILLPKWIIENGAAAAKKVAELEAFVSDT